MLRKLLLTLAFLVTTGAALFAQQGTLKGTVTDASTKEPLPFVNVVVFQDGQQVKGAATDMDGIYTIAGLVPGKYDIQASSMGYHPVKINGVPVSATGFSVNDIQMTSTAIELDLDIVISDYAVPLIDRGSPESGKRIDAEEISRMPVNSVDGIIQSVAGVAYGGSTARGEDGMVTMVGGVRRHGGASNIPKEAIAEVQVILGGTPASIGEAIGGTQVISLKPPASRMMGQVRYETRVDYTGYHRLDMFLSGPLYKKKDQDNVERTIIGYRLSGYGATSQGAYLGKKNRYYMLNEDKRNELLESPLYFDPILGSITTSASYLRADDFEQVKNIPHTRTWSGYAEGALSFRFTDNAILNLSGEYQYGNRSNNNAIPLSYTNKSRTVSNYFSVTADFTHRFADAEGSSVKNIMYNVIASYSRSSGKTFNPDFEEDFFRYGHIGKFTSHYVQNESLRRALNDLGHTEIDVEGVEFEESQRMDSLGNVYTYYEQRRGLPRTDSITFTPNLDHPLSRYTSNMYDIYRSIYNTDPTYKENITENLGLLNGGTPPGVYSTYSGASIFTNVGALYSSYGKSRSDYLYLQAKASADIRGHQIEFGLQYDQSWQRSYSLNARELWTVMREITNNQIMEFDTDGTKPIGVTSEDGSKTDYYIFYNRKYVKESQSTFDIRLRESLGMNVEGTNWIDIDNYDPSTFSLGMFSPDDLFRNMSDNPVVSYKGYDYTGNIVRGKTDLKDYFNNRNRTLGAWAPIYMAGYIQDQFYFSDLVFNVGVRVDYYDANQKVLKDPYLLYGAKKVSDVSGALNPLGYHPGNIGDDYVVYVAKPLTEEENNQEISGYRSGSTWYNAYGVEVASPDEIKGDNTRAMPFRLDRSATNGEIDVDAAFTDYKPQVVVMPRIAFAFPVSDESQFKASYDIISRRPSGGWEAPYYTYLTEYKNMGNNVINNPNLKPERITNYEVSFAQVLSSSSALTIAAYYKETRDLISIIQLAGADPYQGLFHYGNGNYKTTKGVSISYDLRRSKNVRMTANYTLQYAEGTSMPSATLRALMIEGYPNLKLLNPISEDRRHEFKVDFDFRYYGGAQYNGPTTTRKVIEDGVEKSKSIRWLENAGAHIIAVVYSGTPYTKTLSNTQNTIVGDYNGSRLPWQFYLTLQLDKSWHFKSSVNRRSELTAYARLSNPFNIRNVISVYRVTGDPDDNGYLTDPELQAAIRNQVSEISFRDLYKIMLLNNSYNNYSTPRTITLGIQYSF